ncbi:MAG: histidine phosphatase family protein [Burkholderiaceae bacterium]
MGTLYLVRHGQASFGAANYDQLSPLGLQQSHQLGAFFQSKQLTFDAVLCGTLTRHVQTLAGIAQSLGDLPATQALPSLNEYIPEAVIAAVHPGALPKPDTPEAYRLHFQLLRQGLMAWIEGRSQPQGMPAFSDFSSGIAKALAHVQAHTQGHVLLVSSGGPIATAVAQVLGCGAQATVDLNFQLRNSALTEMTFSARRINLVTFNTLPHLQALPDHVTFA